MHFKLLAAAGVACLLLSTPAGAAQSCCDHTKMAGHDMKGGCCDMPCCADKDAKGEPGAIELLLTLETDPQLVPAPPVRQATQVWFQRPVRVGTHILQGRYVIEHDNNRMARGEPCTHIYTFENQKVPVVRFHCTHLERGRAGENIAVLVSTGDGTMQKLLEFQFAGETAAHGVPSDR
jgi:hypothetical protein